MADIDMRSCPMSTWDGHNKKCRLCNKALQGRQRAWCGTRCYRIFMTNHLYSSAKRACLRKSLGKCKCTFANGEKVHHICSKCKQCDRVVGQLECNHIVPRLGDRASISCKHHQTNLEMVCHTCHLGITQEQRHLWPTRNQPKKAPKAKPPRTWTTDF